ncbi:MAG: LPS export ABC transporter periplasmic protein LptC [Magnetococcus sp. DMHC-1]|nr:LPS export ABC transporter periplasmic protein LptC [Magnetococcales bacterium]
MPRRHMKYLFLGISLTIMGGLTWHLSFQGGSVHAPLSQTAAFPPEPPGTTSPVRQGVRAGSGAGTTPHTSAHANAHASATPDAHNEATATGIHLVQDDGQRQKWSLTAASAQKPDSGRILAMQPHLTVFTESGTEITITAHKGTFDNQSREMTFIGSVHITDGADLHLTTSQLRYDPQQHLFVTDRSFRATGRGIEVTGTGLEVYQDTQQIKVLQRVRAVFPDGFHDAV